MPPEFNLGQAMLYINGKSIGEVQSIEVNTIKKEPVINTPPISNIRGARAMTFTYNTGVLFPQELGKLWYMKTHVKTRRLKKKYNKLYSSKLQELMNKYFT